MKIKYKKIAKEMGIPKAYRKSCIKQAKEYDDEYQENYDRETAEYSVAVDLSRNLADRLACEKAETTNPDIRGNDNFWSSLYDNLFEYPMTYSGVVAGVNKTIEECCIKKYDWNIDRWRKLHSGNEDHHVTLTGDSFIYFGANWDIDTPTRITIHYNSKKEMAEWMEDPESCESMVYEDSIIVIKMDEEEYSKAYQLGWDARRDLRFDISMHEIDEMDRYKRRSITPEYAMWFHAYRNGIEDSAAERLQPE